MLQVIRRVSPRLLAPAAFAFDTNPQKRANARRPLHTPPSIRRDIEADAQQPSSSPARSQQSPPSLPRRPAASGHSSAADVESPKWRFSNYNPQPSRLRGPPGLHMVMRRRYQDLIPFADSCWTTRLQSLIRRGPFGNKLPPPPFPKKATVGARWRDATVHCPIQFTSGLGREREIEREPKDEASRACSCMLCAKRKKLSLSSLVVDKFVKAFGYDRDQGTPASRLEPALGACLLCARRPAPAAK